MVGVTLEWMVEQKSRTLGNQCSCPVGVCRSIDVGLLKYTSLVQVKVPSSTPPAQFLQLISFCLNFAHNHDTDLSMSGQNVGNVLLSTSSLAVNV